MARSLALLALAGAAMAAQTTTVSVFLPLFDQQELDASIVAADASKTTFFITCPTSVDSDECGVASGGQSFVYGPKTFALDYNYDGGEEGSYTEEIDCKLDPTKDYVSCSVYVSQDYDGTTTSSSTAVATSGYLDALIPVTVTAGANKLPSDSSDSEETATTLSTVAAPASTTGSADATATESGASQSGSSETSSASKSGSSAASDSASATSTPTASDNAAGAMVTQNAVLVGAAALVGGAALLL